ncbi:MAG: MXAN_5808 family serine peptidase [Deltaproteobacteria bacterium]|nr:MXAN_5808 family serine peptidase [Deltaproteobacteria bacterium]
MTLGLLFLVPVVHASPPDPNYPLENARLVVQTLSHIQRYYVDPSRIHPGEMFEASLNQIQKTVPEISSQCEKNLYCTVTVQQATKRFRYPTKDLSDLATSLKEVFQFIEIHVEKDTDKREIEFAAIDGYLNELDPHSNFLSPDSYREFRVGTEGEFGGLGIVIGLKDGHLTVTAPLDGTPAWKAGVKAGDQIIQINEESTINMTLTEAVSRLRGPVGTKVSIRIERNGRGSPISLTLKRAVINIEAVQSTMVKTPGGNNVGFMRVKSFQANTEQDFHTQLEALNKPENNLKGIILDLRNNPGGLMDQAVTLSDEFLKEGTIVSTVGAGGKVLDKRAARDDGMETNLPLIVLINEGSASASEIVAGALKNNNRAIIVGNRSFGKGSVQSVYELAMESALKLTIAQYLTPGNQSIQSVGIPPDVELLPIIIDKDHLDTVENILMSEKDLEKHFSQMNISEAEKSVYKLGFLAPTPKDDEEPEYHPELKVEGDTTAEVALTLMDGLSSPDRQKMIEEAQKPLAEKQSQENKKIAASFQKLGTDWSLGAGKGNSQAEMSFHLLKGGKPIKRALAGDTVTLRISVKNVGQSPFYRLSAQSTSEEALLKNIEFAFGKLEPGETKSWETKLKIPQPALTEEIPLTLKFSEANGNIPPDVDVIVPIQGLKRPDFAHQYFLEGDLKQIPLGKAVDLKVWVTNQGSGVSKKPVVAIKNPGGKEIYIEKGRVSLDKLEPGKTLTANLRFHIDPSWKGESFPLELTITDTDLLVFSKQDLTFNMANAQITPPAGKLYSPPVITLISKEENTRKNPYILQGDAKDDQNVRDLFIFLDDQKSFYESNAKGGTTFPFSAPLKLKKGNNIISITARDNFNLVSRQFIVIHYDPPSAEDIAASLED